MRRDSYGTERVVLDVSQVILPKKLAVRAIGLRENKEYFIRPGYDDSRRGFVTTTYQPFKNTQVRAGVERMIREQVTPGNFPHADFGYSRWIMAGAPRAPNPLQPGTNPAPSHSRHRGVFLPRPPHAVHVVDMR
jgi:hypothetical protein